jgi:hypothetical protein
MGVKRRQFFAAAGVPALALDAFVQALEAWVGLLSFS